MSEEPAMTFVSCTRHDIMDDVAKCEDCHYELTLKQLKLQEDDWTKRAFYAAQAMAGVELEDCHANWKKWNSPTKKEVESNE